MKRAQSKLLRRLKECEDTFWNLDYQEKEIERRDIDAQYARHWVSLHPPMTNFLCYETTNQRQFYRALAELECLQSLRRENPVAPGRGLGA